MSTANVQGAAQILERPNFLRDVGIGAGAGLLLNSPVLGALGGLAYNLFSTPGMADGMKAAARDAFSGLQGRNPVEGLGGGLFASQPDGQTQADPAAAQAGAQAAEKKSGIPGWAKWLGIGGGALMLFNNLFDNFSMNGFGNPLYGGFGMTPFMDPMATMMGGGMMDPTMGMGMGMMPTNNLLGGMGLMDLLMAGGVGLGAYHLLKR
jgi:hypothetical protein